MTAVKTTKNEFFITLTEEEYSALYHLLSNLSPKDATKILRLVYSDETAEHMSKVIAHIFEELDDVTS